MKSGTLVIYDEDTDYANQLMDYLNRKNNFILNCRMFTMKEGFLDYILKDDIHILLISDKYLEELKLITEQKLSENIKNTIILMDENYKDNQTTYKTLYKYQSADLIAKEILTYYVNNSKTLLSNNLAEGDKNTKIISIFSPSNYTLRTNFSYLLAETYAKKKKTLFLDLDLFSFLSILTEIPIGNRISELIYFLKNDNSNIIVKVNILIEQHNGLDFIAGVEHGLDLYEISKEEIASLIEQIRSFSDYEVIIIDIGFINKTILELFNLSNIILIPNDGTEFSQKQNQDLIKMVQTEGITGIEDKMDFVKLSNKSNNVNDKEYIEVCKDNIRNIMESKIGDMIRSD